mmetsp:Transcript_1162/g.3584  ORF Transcript_1162/g.3584 Transcript_1162/m.3584 type:complete len:482 (+) Transcript_1162:479-1924(+)
MLRHGLRSVPRKVRLLRIPRRVRRRVPRRVPGAGGDGDAELPLGRPALRGLRGERGELLVVRSLAGAEHGPGRPRGRVDAWTLGEERRHLDADHVGAGDAVAAILLPGGDGHEARGHLDDGPRQDAQELQAEADHLLTAQHLAHEDGRHAYDDDVLHEHAGQDEGDRGAALDEQRVDHVHREGEAAVGAEEPPIFDDAVPRREREGLRHFQPHGHVVQDDEDEGQYEEHDRRHEHDVRERVQPPAGARERVALQGQLHALAEHAAALDDEANRGEIQLPMDGQRRGANDERQHCESDPAEALEADGQGEAVDEDHIRLLHHLEEGDRGVHEGHVAQHELRSEAARNRQQDLDHKVFVDSFGRMVQRGVEVRSEEVEDKVEAEGADHVDQPQDGGVGKSIIRHPVFVEGQHPRGDEHVRCGQSRDEAGAFTAAGHDRAGHAHASEPAAEREEAAQEHPYAAAAALVGRRPRALSQQGHGAGP